MTQAKLPELKDYVVARRQEIFDEIAVLQARLTDLDRERRQLDALSRAYDHVGADSKLAEVSTSTAKNGEKLTIKEAVVATLGQSPDGLRIQDLIKRMRDVTGLEVAETSLWPQMNRLKNKDGKIINEGGVWRLSERNDQP